MAYADIPPSMRPALSEYDPVSIIIGGMPGGGSGGGGGRGYFGGGGGGALSAVKLAQVGSKLVGWKLERQSLHTY